MSITPEHDSFCPYELSLVDMCLYADTCWHNNATIHVVELLRDRGWTRGCYECIDTARTLMPKISAFWAKTLADSRPRCKLMHFGYLQVASERVNASRCDTPWP